jgi:hypothetical protein
MYFSKSRREALRRQFNGCCAYCGETLPLQGWHAEAISEELVKGGVVPVCTTCRQIKGNASPEEFRALLAVQVERALRHSVNFRTAMRFGLVSQQVKKVEFWFQRCSNAHGLKTDKAMDTPAASHDPARDPRQTRSETAGNNV